MGEFIKYYKFFIIAVIIGLFLFIFYGYFAISGHLSITYNVCDKPTLISLLTPSGRVLDAEKNQKTGDCYQRLTGEPIYFSASVPRSFNEAEVTLTYKNPEQNIIELGLEKTIAENYELQPMENKFIDDSLWDKLTSDNYILLQKNNNYKSVEDFTSNIPLNAKIATYHYSPEYNFKIDNYQPSNSILEINKALRGKHVFYTYLKNEDLDFAFAYQDLNWSFPQENFIVRVYKDETELTTVFEPSTDTNEHEKRVQLTGLGGGLYKIVLDISDDIIIKKITTKQHLLVAKDKLFLVDNEAYGLETKPSTVYSNSDEFLFKTDHESGLQDVNIAGEDLSVNKLGGYILHRLEEYNVGSFKEISIPKNDLLIQGYGYFSFNKEDFFDPDYGIDVFRSEMDIEQYDYIIADNYISPDTQAGWKTATAKYNLDGVLGDRKNLNFAISAPGLADTKDDILIKDINITLKRDPITFKYLWNKIFK
jgi:hypothetical protein